MHCNMPEPVCFRYCQLSACLNSLLFHLQDTVISLLLVLPMCAAALLHLFWPCSQGRDPFSFSDDEEDDSTSFGWQQRKFKIHIKSKVRLTTLAPTLFFPRWSHSAITSGVLCMHLLMHRQYASPDASRMGQMFSVCW